MVVKSFVGIITERSVEGVVEGDPVSVVETAV